MRPFPYSMKNLFRIAALACCGFVGTTSADDFKSITITGSGSPVDLPRIHGDQFMLIRNFTQDVAESPRGVVTVTRPPTSVTPVNVLAAAILTASPPDVINSVVIAGPADVTATCPTDAICFISFKKASN